MSHIHIPDGILSAPIWISTLVLTLFIIGYIVKTLEKQDTKKILPFVGIMAALMLLTMSIPLFIIPLHLSLAVMIGILLGPKLGFLVVFVVITIMSFFGHGGVTLIGLNTLIIGSEVFIGSFIFRRFQHKHIKRATILATVIALLISMTLMVGIVTTTVGFEEALPHSHHHEEGDEEHHDHDHDHDHWYDAIFDVNYFVFSGWIALLMILIVGIGLETAATVLIVSYFIKARPDLFRTKMNENA